MVESVKLDILDACVSKKYLYKGKIRLSVFHKKLVSLKFFVKTLITLGFRCRVISDSFLVFGVKILPQKNASLVFKIIKNNAQFITTINQ